MPRGIYKIANRTEVAKKFGIGKWMKGKKRSEETKKKISNSTSGAKSWRWIKDRTKLQRYAESNKERRSSIYRDWRNRVWERDNFKCKINNKDCSGRLEAHHILGFTDHSELRYDINNGITLCHAHHPRKREQEAKLSPYFQSLVAEVK